MNRILKISIILFVLIDIILLALYFFSSSFPNFLSFRRPKQVTFSSDVPNISLKPTNSSFLNKKLEELNFWGEDKVIVFDPKGKQLGPVTATSLDIFLTRHKQPLGQLVDAEDETLVYQSYGMQYDLNQRRVDLYIYINPDLLAKEDVKDLSSRMSWQVFSALFDITHPIPEVYTSKPFARFEGKDAFEKSLQELPDRAFVSVVKK